MENRKLVRTGVCIGLATFLLPVFVYAYSAHSTHPALTDEIVDYFNHEYPEHTLADEEKELIKKGSAEEDAPIFRVVNHFYDPVYHVGLKGTNPTAREWATNTVLQGQWRSGAIAAPAFAREFFSAEQDYTWERSVFDYAHKDKERGLKALGHILHLIEDATVPDHTRDDMHPPAFDFGSPYEAWASQWTPENTNIASELTLEGRRPVAYATLGEYFDAVATYSNNNFFSKDTIFEKKYLQPLVVEEKKEILTDNKTHIFGLNSKNVRLVEIEEKFNFTTGKYDRLYKIKDIDDLIFSDYWRLLSREAVLNGAGIVKLFFDEVEKEKKTLALLEKNKSTLAKLKDKIMASVFDSKPLVIEARDAGAAVALAPLPEETPPPPESYTSILQNNGITADNSPLEGSTPPTGGGRDVETEETGLSYAEVLENIRTTAPSVSPLPASSAGEEGSTPTSPTGEVGGRGVLPVYNPIPVPTGPGGFRGGGGSPRAEVAAAPAASASAEVATPAESVEEGSEGDSSSMSALNPPTAGAVVINELAWRGTVASADDEWVELYNTTSAEVSLASTTLLSSDGSPYLPLSGTIAGGGYFLIERKQTGETSEAAGSPLSDLTANLWTDFGTGLSDAGEVLTLAYFNGTATTTIDTAGFSDCADWCGKGGGANFVSMEKIAPSQNGTAATSWLANGGNTTGMRNGVARNGDIVNGTPGAKNYAAFLVNGGSDLTEGSLTLAATGSPYLVDNEWFTVASGTTLTIETGAIVKFYNTAGLKVDGALNISGTAENPAVLTSFFDDSYSGDTNRDGSSTSPQAGDWYGVEYRAGSSGSITGALVRYGGKFFNGDSETRAGVALTNASPSISNSSFEYGSRYGLLLTNASSTISGNTFRNHTTTSDSYGIVGSGGAPTISGNTFSNNSVGLFFSDSSGTFSNNTFTNNTNGAFSWGGNLKGAGRISGNSGTGNGSYNGVRLPSGNLMYADTSSVFSKNASSFPYLLPSTSEVPIGATLTAEAGSIWKFDRSPFNIYGTLRAEGTATENVIFSSIYDNESPVPIINGTGIVLQNGSVSDFTNATLRYMKVALSYDNAPLSLENVSLTGNALGISGTASTTITKAINVSFVNNTATSTIPL